MMVLTVVPPTTVRLIQAMTIKNARCLAAKAIGSSRKKSVFSSRTYVILACGGFPAFRALPVGKKKSFFSPFIALNKLKVAAGKNDSAAEYELGKYYYELKNYNKALKWYKKAADSGMMRAQEALGELYLNGKDIPLNSVKGAKYLLSAAKHPWVLDNTWNFQNINAKVAKICMNSRKIPIPVSDLPPINQVANLKNCNSEGLYYGIGQNQNYVKARYCAYLQRPTLRNGNGFGYPDFAGQSILMMLYANGLGVKRNIPLAIKFACETAGAPAEIDGRVCELKQMQKKHYSGHNFDFCDDATSGDTAGGCELRTSWRQQTLINPLLSYLNRLNPSVTKAFKNLRKAARKFFKEQAWNEQDMTGTLRDVFYLQQYDLDRKMFAGDVLLVDSGMSPNVNAKHLKEANLKLQKLYRTIAVVFRNHKSYTVGVPFQEKGGKVKVIKVTVPYRGTITLKGIRKSEISWINYKNAWEHFLTVRKNSTKNLEYPGILKTKITSIIALIVDQRIEQLRLLIRVWKI